ncbi:hypothetical protein RHSIM_Rhsim13G0195300 [Rhododendron simsii]|uniref:Nuclear speckle splicing regulatory protein 1 N-terminal domain-containing protein n=1 Tax=Rhododendron simsii TaxID=118357 RepID=A0A834L670_RHOSS|nr:hypothetical protein RHSIM_Rhsim13G0195300 [Rhododendron simsii]
MKKYGLQLRAQSSQRKKQPGRPPLPTPLGFHDQDDDDVEREISRQASKNKALKDIEEQHKKALEEDPSVFDYDGVYEDMKQKVARPLAHDRQERKPKYIQALIDKAKQREREQEIVYERKLAKERDKDDHLFADKDKFVTSAYKKKLAEQAMWLEEERLRQLREENEDVTKKKDITDFYFNLSKNVAFGAQEAETRKSGKRQKEASVVTSEERPQLTKSSLESTELSKGHRDEASRVAEERFEPIEAKPASRISEERSEPIEAKPIPDAPAPAVGEQPLADQPRRDHHHKRNEDSVAAAKERFLARKRVKEQ